MVGVPGRSKACHTCKRRKKGCDRREPSCGQCTRASIPCGGYDKACIFINSSQKHGDAKSYRFMPESYAPLPLTQPRSHTLRRKSPSSSVPIVSPMLERSLERVALQSQCFDNFWSALLPNGQIFSGQAARYSTAGWTRVVQDLCQRDDLVRLALLANALGMLGEQIRQQSMIVEGWRAYGRSLQVLARSLPTMGEVKGDELLTTSLLLAQYELLQGARSRYSSSASGDRWFRHAFGEKAIILARSSQCYVEGRAHQLFIDSRLHLIYPNIRNRKRSSFSSPEWKSIPWSLSPKDPKNELLDVLIDIPGILEDLDELLGCPSDQIERQMYLREQLEESCRLHDTQLQRWSATSGSSTVNFVESKLSTENQEPSTPSSEDFAMAHLGMLYWTTCLLLYQTLWHLNGHDWTKLPERMDPRQFCRKIALLMPYFQCENMGEFFMNITAFPAITATRFLDRHDPPNKPSEERRILLKAFRGKYQRQMENFLGTWPWRSAKWE